MKRAAALIVTLFLCVVALTAQQPAPAFRAAVDLIAVDVQVVDKNGAPLTRLLPRQFAVTIGGKARNVVSADLVSVETTVPATPPTAQATPPTATPPAAAPEPGRTYILAVDAMSFQPADFAPAREAARAFVDRLRPNDRVGLAVFPFGPFIDITTNHARTQAALGQVVGQGDSESSDQLQLSPSSIVDLALTDVGMATRDIDGLRRADPALVAKLLAICSDPPERVFCIPDLVARARAQGQFQQAQARDRMSALRATLQSLRGMSQRKIVVLVSGGMMSSDRTGSAPNVGDVGRLVGQAAAEVNASVYTLFFDRLGSDRATFARRTQRPAEAARDSAMLARPLEAIADASGGAFLRIAQGSGDFAFERILQETSAYYVLGVEPDARDRDGKPHELRVKVDARDSTVRGRSWVVLPAAPAPAK